MKLVDDDALPKLVISVCVWLHFAPSFGGVDMLFPDTVEAEWQSPSTSICAIQAGAQLCVFCLRLPVDGTIGVGILPQRQEILIRFSCCARILHEYLSTRQLQNRKASRYEAFPDPGMIENLSELTCRQPPLLQLEIGKASQVRRIYA